MFFAPAIALSAVSLLCSVLACMMPFAGIATVAALFLKTRTALIVLVFAWAANQIVGFTMLGYPWTPSTFAWGPVLLIAAFASYVAARVASKSVNLAFLAAWCAKTAVLALFTIKLGSWSDYAPATLAATFVSDALWFAALFVLVRMLGARRLTAQ